MHAWHKKFWRIRYLTLNHIWASNYEPVPCIDGLCVQKYTYIEKSFRKEKKMLSTLFFLELIGLLKKDVLLKSIIEILRP